MCGLAYIKWIDSAQVITLGLKKVVAASSRQVFLQKLNDRFVLLIYLSDLKVDYFFGPVFAWYFSYISSIL